MAGLSQITRRHEPPSVSRGQAPLVKSSLAWVWPSRAHAKLWRRFRHFPQEFQVHMSHRSASRRRLPLFRALFISCTVAAALGLGAGGASAQEGADAIGATLT